MLAGTSSLVGIVAGAARQAASGSSSRSSSAFFIFLVAGVAETNRTPFDLPEAESELVAGFHTEYSGMQFALFFLAEYANMFVDLGDRPTLFLGGWLPPFPNLAPLPPSVVPGWIWFVLKVFVFLFLFIWFRGTLPRYRFDE